MQNIIAQQGVQAIKIPDKLGLMFNLVEYYFASMPSI